MTISREDKQSLTRWLQTQRAKPQYRPSPTAGMAASRIVRPLSKKHGSGSSAMALEPIWPEIMGPRWSKISSPVRFLGGKSGRTLIISAPGPAAALIMAASRPIIERLNSHLGQDHIKRIHVVQSKMHVPPPKAADKGLSPRKTAELQKSLSNLDDNDVKKALEKLGRNVFKEEEL